MSFFLLSFFLYFGSWSYVFLNYFVWVGLFFFEEMSREFFRRGVCKVGLFSVGFMNVWSFFIIMVVMMFCII